MSFKTECRACCKQITMLKILTSSSHIPVDGHVSGEFFDPAKHTSHFETCPNADRFRGQGKEYQRRKRNALKEVKDLSSALRDVGCSVSALQNIAQELAGFSSFNELKKASLTDLEGLLLPCLKDLKKALSHAGLSDWDRLSVINRVTGPYQKKAQKRRKRRKK